MKKSALALLGLLVVMSATACKKEEPIETTVAVETEIETTEEETTIAETEPETTAEKTTVAETEESTAVEIEAFQAETLEMLKSDWDACRVTQQEVEEVYFADDLMLSEAGKEEMRQYMIDHPQVKETQPVETQAPVKETQAVETKPVETQAPETQAPVNNVSQETLSAEEKAELGLVDADEFFSSMDDEEGVTPGNSVRPGQTLN